MFQKLPYSSPKKQQDLFTHFYTGGPLLPKSKKGKYGSLENGKATMIQCAYKRFKALKNYKILQDEAKESLFLQKQQQK